MPPAQIRPVLEATKAQLITLYNQQARAIHSVNAAVRMHPVAGSEYSGVIEEYRDVGGFILAARPAMIRVIGQAPVVAKNIFDMVSDGDTFRIYIPSKNKFLVGSTSLERVSTNALENLRPQHILDALFLQELPEDAAVLFEEFDVSPARYYVLTLLRGTNRELEAERKIWFDRADLRMSRVQVYGPAGRLDADIEYRDWKSTATASAASAASGEAPTPLFPHEIRITRPHQDYQLGVSITRVTLNAEVPADRFDLPQPSGTELVRVGGPEAEAQP